MRNVLLAGVLMLAGIESSADVFVFNSQSGAPLIRVEAWGEIRIRGTSSRTLTMTLTRTAHGLTTTNRSRKAAGIGVNGRTIVVWSDIAGDVELEVPHDAQLSARSFRWGSVTVENVCGDVEVTSHEGGVRLLGIGGAIVAHAANGPIQADLAWSTPHPVSLTSMHGGIEISIPQGIRVLPRLRTEEGPVRSDLPWEGALRRGSKPAGDSGLTRLLAYTRFGAITLRQTERTSTCR